MVDMVSPAIDVFLAAVALAQQIRAMVQDIRENRKDCERLCKKIDRVLNIINDSEIRDIRNERLKKAMEDFYLFLEECYIVISKMRNTNILRHAFNRNLYTKRIKSLNEELLYFSQALILGGVLINNRMLQSAIPAPEQDNSVINQSAMSIANFEHRRTLRRAEYFRKHGIPANARVTIPIRFSQRHSDYSQNQFSQSSAFRNPSQNYGKVFSRQPNNH